MALALDRQLLSDRLARLEDAAVVAFIACCAQRRECCVRSLEVHGRGADLATFRRILDALWSVASGEVDPGTVSWGALDDFEEVQSDEEAEGTMAYAEDGIVALWYGTQFMLKRDRAFAVHCASRSYDSAGFVDDLTGEEGSTFSDSEAWAQLDDIERLGAPGALDPALLRELRCRAGAESDRISERLPRAELQ